MKFIIKKCCHQIADFSYIHALLADPIALAVCNRNRFSRENATEGERIENCFGVVDESIKQSPPLHKPPAKCYKPCITALLLIF